MSSDILHDRLPPQNQEAERCVLGAMLRNNRAIDDVVLIIRKEDFYADGHQKIFETMVALNDQGGRPVDTVILHDALLQREWLADVGGPAYLAGLWDCVPSSANVEYYARIVREKALLRNLILTSNETLGEAYSQTMPADQLIESAQRKIFDLAEKGMTSHLTTLDAAIQETYDLIDQRSQNMDLGTSGLDTGYTDLNELTAGLHKRELVIIAARPSVGKCLSADSEIVLRDGSIATIGEIYRRRQAQLLTLGDDWRLGWTQPSAFVDDGLKPVSAVTTKLGRRIEATASHPFLTSKGWRPLGELRDGDRIAIPRTLAWLGGSNYSRTKVDFLFKHGNEKSTPVESEAQARRMQHRLLRFGKLASIYQKGRRWEVSLVDEKQSNTKGDIYWDEITRIQSLGPKQVYDLTIPQTHNFVANDICVHNTAFSLGLARNVVLREKVPVFFVSLEQSRVEIAERLLCSQARVDSHRLRKGSLTTEDMERLIEAGGVLRNAKLFIDDTPSQGMLRIAANARRLKRANDIQLIIIDYLQLIEPENRRDPRQEQVAQISRRLKFLARELEIPVVALAQVNRASEDRQDHRPRLSDLRESGSIEQDADTVFMLHRPDRYEPGQHEGIIEVIVAKNRNGPVGEVTLAYIKQYLLYEDFKVGTAFND